MDMNVYYLPDRRCGDDRRKNKIPIITISSLLGRRRIPRRQEDREGSFAIDVYCSKTLFVILLIVSLSVLDAMLTLYLVGHGAVEMNPVMAYFLSHGPLIFFGAKYLLTCSCTMLVLINSRSFLFGTKIRAEALFVAFVIPFALVVKWQLYLIFFVL